MLGDRRRSSASVRHSFLTSFPTFAKSRPSTVCRRSPLPISVNNTGLRPTYKTRGVSFNALRLYFIHQPQTFNNVRLSQVNLAFAGDLVATETT
jgi:hypothetical protein